MSRRAPEVVEALRTARPALKAFSIWCRSLNGQFKSEGFRTKSECDAAQKAFSRHHVRWQLPLRGKTADVIVMTRIKFLSVVAIVGIASLSCAEHDAAAVQEKRDQALVVLPGARDVKALKDLDGGVEYVFENAYPASVTIGFIGKQLEAAKWRQTTEDLTTATPSGSDREWSHYGEADHEVYAWAGAWKNEAGDLVIYYLRYYFTGPSTASSRDLHIKALKASRETVERVRKSFPR